MLPVPLSVQLIQNHLYSMNCKIGIKRRTTCPTYLLHDDAMCLIPHSQPAKFLIRCYAQEPRFTKLLPHLVRELVYAVGFLCQFFGDLSSYRQPISRRSTTNSGG